MSAVILVCRRCTALLTRPLEPWSHDEWNRAEYSVPAGNPLLVDEQHVVRWSDALWTEDNRYLPFPSDVWVVAPDALALELWVTTREGCCGFPPAKDDAKNQICLCGELIGWHNTDCLLPQFVAFAADDVEAIPA